MIISINIYKTHNTKEGNMFKKITNIKIKGGIFKESTNLNLFDNEKNVIIYGKNGSGKTTISRGFRKIKGFQEESVEIFELLNKGDEVIQISEEKKNIFKFLMKILLKIILK